MTCNSYLGRKTPSFQISPPSFFPQPYMLSMTLPVCDIPLLGVSCSSCVPSKFLCTPSPPAFWLRSRKALQELHSSSKTISILLTLFPAQVQSTDLCQLLWRLSVPKPAQLASEGSLAAGSYVCTGHTRSSFKACMFQWLMYRHQ